MPTWNEKHSHKLSNAKVAQCEWERTACRPCAVFPCCFGFLLLLTTVRFLLSSREHIHSYVRHIHSGDGRWKMWNMSSKRRQRHRRWNEEIKFIKRNHTHAPLTQRPAHWSEGEKLWIAKRMICSQIGEKIKWYFQLLSHEKQNKQRKNVGITKTTNRRPTPQRFFLFFFRFHFSSVSHFLTSLLGMTLFSFVWFYGRVSCRIIPFRRRRQATGKSFPF